MTDACLVVYLLLKYFVLSGACVPVCEPWSVLSIRGIYSSDLTFKLCQ